jgi:NADH:ubiquinone oxidoreductase subunit 6 (subunit J)
MLDDEAAERIVQTPVTNTERVGLDLFRSHMLGLELAGVILLVSLVGAVVIARQKVNLMEADADTAEEAAA